ASSIANAMVRGALFGLVLGVFFAACQLAATLRLEDLTSRDANSHFPFWVWCLLEGLAFGAGTAPSTLFERSFLRVRLGRGFPVALVAVAVGAGNLAHLAFRYMTE